MQNPFPTVMTTAAGQDVSYRQAEAVSCAFLVMSIQVQQHCLDDCSSIMLDSGQEAVQRLQPTGD